MGRGGARAARGEVFREGVGREEKGKGKTGGGVIEAGRIKKKTAIAGGGIMRKMGMRRSRRGGGSLRAGGMRYELINNVKDMGGGGGINMVGGG